MLVRRRSPPRVVLFALTLQSVVSSLPGADPAPPVPVLPAETPLSLDLGALAQAPRETWYAFHFGDHDAHIGYEHQVLRLEQGRLVADYDFAFAALGMPIIATYQEATYALPAPLLPLSAIPPILTAVTDGQDALDHSTAHRTTEGGMRLWVSETAQHQAGGGWAILHARHLLPEVPLAEALQSQLGGFLAHRVGACVHVGAWRSDHWQISAWRVMGDEDLALPQQPHRHAWKVQQFGVDDPGIIAWFGDDGTCLKTAYGDAYGGAWSVIAQRSAALSDLAPTLRVRLGAALVPLSTLHIPPAAQAATPTAAGGGF